MPQFSEIFYTSLISTLSGIFLAILAACYKSKCSDVSLCYGLIELKRNVNIEMVEDMRPADNTNNTATTRASIDRLPADAP